jgi:hypothetical protein
MNEEHPIKTEIVYRFTSEQERDSFCLAAQWPDDRAKFKKLITATSLNEIFNEGDI